MRHRFEIFTLGVALVIFSGIILSSLALGSYLLYDYRNIEWSDEKRIVEEGVIVDEPQIVGAVVADSFEEDTETVMEEVIEKDYPVTTSNEGEIVDLYLYYPKDFVEVWKDTASFSIDAVNNGSVSLIVNIKAQTNRNKSLIATPDGFGIPPDSMQKLHIGLDKVFLTNNEDIIIRGTAPGVDRTLVLRVRKHNENNVKNVKSGLSGCGEFALY